MIVFAFPTGQVCDFLPKWLEVFWIPTQVVYRKGKGLANSATFTKGVAYITIGI